MSSPPAEFSIVLGGTYSSMHLFGDSLYMIGGGVFGSGTYEYMIHKSIEPTALVCGIIMIIAGAYIRHINKK